MVIERAAGLKFRITFRTRNALCVLIHLHEEFHLFLKVNTKAVNYTISLCKRSEVAGIKWTGKLLVFFRICLKFRMLRTNMKIQRLLLKETLFTRFANMVEFLHMLLHVIMHGILTGFHYATVRAYKVPLLILDIGQCHGFGWWCVFFTGQRHFNFYLSIDSASEFRLGAYS